MKTKHIFLLLILILSSCNHYHQIRFTKHNSANQTKSPSEWPVHHNGIKNNITELEVDCTSKYYDNHKKFNLDEIQSPIDLSASINHNYTVPSFTNQQHSPKSEFSPINSLIDEATESDGKKRKEINPSNSNQRRLGWLFFILGFSVFSLGVVLTIFTWAEAIMIIGTLLGVALITIGTILLILNRVNKGSSKNPKFWKRFTIILGSILGLGLALLSAYLIGVN